ncbi:YheC/YheD family protein [Chengkuizengella axinellae]|uniref:YheC/YheD family protein n=1 Tax=Chengkuizengella axinellae TaxID=3064388 RepID=A0ABT9J1G4_9BACL|nr:YheC/YheD family protein [Chengkuizengella sp. 2205SS18-9]MDP5275456.1 YheC/YheD family protein [Chengkuizengella sp. 2205SS18-9]
MITLGKIASHKWAKYKIMMKKEALIPYLPETRMMDKNNLWHMLEKYEHVIIKPSSGSRGRDVFLVSSLGDNQYKIHHENKIVTKKGKKKTDRFLKNTMDHYIIQQSINRPTIDESPFDFRVMAQRKSKSKEWVVTGKVTKIAGEGFIVSNITRSKGRVMQPSDAIEHATINEKSYKSLLAKIDRVSLLTANHLAKYYKKNRIFGFDIALDQEGHVWILEANLKPALSHFKKLKDKKMYHRIKRYKKS